MSTAIQDELFPHLNCFGCGPANVGGLQLKSYREGDRVAATFTSLPVHDNGFGFLNGGIIATVLDCHSAAAVVVETAKRYPDADSVPTFLTAGIEVRYLRPTPLSRSVDLSGEVVSASEDEMVVMAQLRFEGRACATGRAIWKRWQPR